MDDLSTSQREELQEDLRRLLIDLQRQLEASREGSQVVSLDEPIGRLTRMDAIQQQKMTQALRGDAGTRLRQVQAALQRSADDYGACIQCEEAIGFARLKVRPEVTLCIDCQTQREGSSTAAPII